MSPTFTILALFACTEPAKDTDSGSCTATSWFADGDGDGVGAGTPSEACDAPAGHVASDGDCDDADASSFPGAAEACDGRDNNCDGAADEDATDAFTAYADADGDGYGDAGVQVEVCALGEGVSDVAGDCDDAQATVNPDAVERCDTVDNNCDGVTDGIAVPGDHATVAAAVAAAAAGDLVCLAAGAFAETVTVDKSLRIGGAGADATQVGVPRSTTPSLVVTSGGVEILDLSAVGISVSASEGVLLDGVRSTGGYCTSTNCAGTGLRVVDSTVELHDVVVTDTLIEYAASSTHTIRGVVSFEDSDVTWVGGGLVDNEVSSLAGTTLGYGLLRMQGGAVHAEGIDISENIVGVFANGAASTGTYYGLVYASAAEVDFVDVHMADNTMDVWATAQDSAGAYANAQSAAWFVVEGGALSWVGGGITDNIDSTQATNTAYVHGASTTQDTTLTDVVIRGNVVAAGSGANGFVQCIGLQMSSGVSSLTRLDVRDNRLSCDSTGAIAPGLLWASTNTIRLTNTIFANNEVSSGGAAHALLSFNSSVATPTITNSTFIGNTVYGYHVAAGVFHADGTGLTILNTAVTNNGATADDTDSWDYPAASVLAVEQAHPLSVTYSLFWGNSSSSGYEFLWSRTNVGDDTYAADGVQAADPMYTSVATAEGAGWDLHPSASSPLVDAGSPDVTDVDGSRSDVGGYGGPYGSR